MNPLLKSFLLALIAFVAGYALCYRLEVVPERALERSDRTGVDWLRKEFHLTPQQLSTILKIDADFTAHNEETYRRLNELYGKADALIARSQSVTPEVDAALRECAEVQAESCRTALKHMYAIAGQLPPQESARYIKILQPHILEPAVFLARVH